MQGLKPANDLEKEYERLSKELELCTTIVSHDMKNYLQQVFFKIDEIERGIDNPDESISIKMEQLRSMLRRMGNLLGFMSLPTKLTDDPMVYIIEQIAAHVEGIFEGMHISVEAESQEREMRVQGGHLLPMVFANLFMNSVEHGGKEVRVEIRAIDKKNQAEIVISDDGPGIDTDIREKLFQKGASTTGGGLGLYLVREILKVHNGTIEFINSDRYNGAAFRILLPLIAH